MRLSTKKLIIIFFGLLFMVLYCEIFIYYVVIAQCYWPAVNETDTKEVLRAFMLTDIHMLGPKRGNIIDKWRREWQMHRAFQTIITLHDPDIVFVLGDSFDEGEISSKQQFDSYVEQFRNKFYVPEHISMFILTGNHDVGFHNFIKPGNIERFYEKMNATSVRLMTLKNSHFVLINSMAMEGDNCNLCRNARKEIEEISAQLFCSSYSNCSNEEIQLKYSRPILVQHFPLYRESDAICAREWDAVPWYEKDIPFRHKIDDLSQEATDYLARAIKPRAVFGGHTHYSCLIQHKYEDIEFTEYSIPSFSWRNIFLPKYFLVTITPKEYSVNKCGLPGEHTIVITAVIILFVTIIISRRRI